LEVSFCFFISCTLALLRRVTLSSSVCMIEGQKKGVRREDGRRKMATGISGTWERRLGLAEGPMAHDKS
jgi:hypothetical protein